MKIAHLSDLHLCEGPRFLDTLAALDTVIEETRHEVSAYFITGDLYDHLGRPSTPSERNALADRIILMACQAPVFIVKGNHDRPGDLRIFHRLTNVHVAERAEVFDARFGDPSIPFRVVLLPYPDKRWLGTDSGEAARQAVSEGLRTILAPEQGTRPLIAAHINVAGSVASTGQPMIGQDVELALGDLLDVKPRAVLLGHIHKHQALSPEAVYAGSLVAHDYGETEDKGYVIWEFSDAGELGGWVFHTVGARKRRTYHVEIGFAYTPEGAEAGLTLVADDRDEADVGGDYVRVQYDIPAGLVDSFDEQLLVRWLKLEHAYEVTLERRTIPAVAVRCSSVSAAVSTEDKLRAYLTDACSYDEDKRQHLLAVAALLQRPDDAESLTNHVIELATKEADRKEATDETS